MANNIPDILYLAPSDPSRTPIAEYARSYASAFGQSDRLNVIPLLGRETPEHVDAHRGDLKALKTKVGHFLSSMEPEEERLFHAEIGPTTVREFWVSHLASQSRPEIPLCLTLHDPPRLIASDRESAPNPRAGLIERILDTVTGSLSMMGRRKLETNLLARAALLVTLSRHGAELLATAYPAHAHKIVHLPPLAVGPIPPNREPNHRRSSESIRVLILCPRPTEIRFDDVIGALINLRRTVVFSRLEIRIRGDFGNGTSRDLVTNAIKKRIGALDMASSVDFRPGMLPPAQLGALLAETEIVVLPYAEGACGGASPALMQAQTSAVAVVASDVGGLPEMLQNGSEGMLYKAGDPAGLSRCIAELVSKPEERMNMAGKLRDRALRERSPERISGLMYEIYLDVLAARRQNRPLRLPAGARIDGA